MSLGKRWTTKSRRGKFNGLNDIVEICPNHLDECGPDAASSLASPLCFKQEEYIDKKGKNKTRKDESSAPVLYCKLIYSEKSNKILSLFKSKGNKNVDPFDYLNQ